MRVRPMEMMAELTRPEELVDAARILNGHCSSGVLRRDWSWERS